MTDLTALELLALHAPIDFAAACSVWGADPNLADDRTRAAFFAVWALARFEWANAMLSENARLKSEGQ